MFCKYCGKELNNNVAFCPQCGKPTADSQTGGPQQTGDYTQQPASDQTLYQEPQCSYASENAAAAQKEPNGYATASLVLGILGICFILPFLGGILAIIFSNISSKISVRKGEYLSMARTGMILGIIAIIANIVLIIIFIAL